MTRLLIVGFDGATLELCQRWIEAGRMPTLRSLMDDGSYGTLRSTLPYNSAVAWTSLSTGTTPGRHGIFDFILPRAGQYGYRVATRSDRRTPAIWNIASDAGARVAVVNIPMTFPAEHIDGVMVSGMDAPRLEERAVHPAGYLAELRRLAPDYGIVSKAAVRAAQGDFDGAERELIDVMIARSRFVERMAAGRDFDMIMVNLEATDGAHHFFWQHLDPTHPRHDPAGARAWGETIARVYEASDRELGRLIDSYAPDTILVASDHGGGPSSDWVLFMNDWLAREGFLLIVPRRVSRAGRRLYDLGRTRLSVPLRRRLRPLVGGLLEQAKGVALYGDVDWSRSRAYALMQAAVRVNLSGREPEGTVGPSEMPLLLDELASRAEALRLPDAGPAFAAVHRAVDVYGQALPGGPDLLMETAPGLHIRGRNNSSVPGHMRRVDEIGSYFPTGVHTPTGIIVGAGSGIERRGRVEEADILQFAPSALAIMGIAAPPMDAEPFSFVTRSLVSAGDGGASEQHSDMELETDEEAEIMERLRGLGYID
jgi:predicted AlkP superfamily phosphohydrolase/phosphomutase